MYSILFLLFIASSLAQSPYVQSVCANLTDGVHCVRPFGEERSIECRDGHVPDEAARVAFHMGIGIPCQNGCNDTTGMCLPQMSANEFAAILTTGVLGGIAVLAGLSVVIAYLVRRRIERREVAAALERIDKREQKEELADDNSVVDLEHT